MLCQGGQGHIARRLHLIVNAILQSLGRLLHGHQALVQFSNLCHGKIQKKLGEKSAGPPNLRLLGFHTLALREDAVCGDRACLPLTLDIKALNPGSL